MNHRYRHAPQHLRLFRSARVFALAAALLGCASVCSTAWAQRAGLPSDLKTAPDARPRLPEIRKFVEAQVALLNNDKDPAAQQRARDLLVKEGSPGGSQPSTSFLDAYATTLNELLLPLTKSPNARTRLNAAIVVQRVAKSSNSGKFEGITAVLAQDSCAGVALWGMRAAQSVLPIQAASGQGAKLSAAVLAGAKTHANAGDVLEDAFKAITLAAPKNVTAASVPVVTADVVKLLESRVAQYIKQTPVRSDLDARAVTFLTLSRVLETKEGTKLRPQIMQALSNLAGVTAQHAAARTTDATRRPFVDVLKRIGDALMAIAGNDEKLKAAGKSLFDLQPSMAAGEFTDRANAAYEALKAQLPALTPPPTIESGATEEAKEAVPEENVVAASQPADGATAPAPKTAAPAPKPAAPKPAGAQPPTTPRPPAQPRRNVPAAEKPEAP